MTFLSVHSTVIKVFILCTALLGSWFHMKKEEYVEGSKTFHISTISR